MKKIIEYFNLKKRFCKLMAELQRRMIVINETMELKDVTDVYSEYVCKMHNWSKFADGGLTHEFCEVGFSFMNGYVKALHDNGLEFQNGLVKKRDVTEYMPSGALDYYRKDAIKDTKAHAVEALQMVMEHYETSKTNIATIVSAFKKEIEKNG